MRQLVEFGLNHGGTILLEVHKTASATILFIHYLYHPRSPNSQANL